MDQKEISTYLENYYQDCSLRKRLSHQTLKAYKIDLNQYFDFIGTEINNTKKMTNYILWLNQKYAKPKTVKRKIASVKAFYTYLEYEEMIINNPFRKMRTLIKEPKLLPKTIPTQYLTLLFHSLYASYDNAQTQYQKYQALRNIAVIELLFSTGIRISELCHIHNEDLDIEMHTLKIMGKGAKERLLYIGNDDVIDVLRRYHQLKDSLFKDHDYFFVNKLGNRLSEQSVRLLLNNLEEKLHIPIHMTPHMFRHTFATTLLEKEVDIRYIQKILGHSSISVTQIYTHVSYQKQKEILSIKNPMNDFVLSYEKDRL